MGTNWKALQGLGLGAVLGGGASVATGVDRAHGPDETAARVVSPKTVKLDDGRIGVHVGVRDGQDVYMWEGGETAITVSHSFVSDATAASAPRKYLAFEDLSREQHARVIAAVNDVNAIGGNVNVDLVMNMVNWSPEGAVRLQGSASDTTTALKELAEQFRRIEAAARKQRNAKKRDRRARRGK